MGDSKKRGYQKNKQYFQHSNKKRKLLFLEPGAKGFFCTCNFQEKNCIREAYNLLNEYADKLYGPAESPEKLSSKDDDQAVENEDEEDLSDMLEKQIADIKSEDHKTRRFQSLVTSVTNCIFIQGNIDDPVKLGHKIVEDIANTKIQKTRFLLRLIPVEATCSVKLPDIIDTAGKLFDKYFLGEPMTFSIVFNKRYNNSVSRDIVIKELADLVVSKNSSHKADLTKPKLAVIVEIIKGTCLLSVLPDYFQLKKYNIVALCSTMPEKNKDPSTEDDAGEKENPEPTVDEKHDS